jgi:hypothetical protein
MADSFSAKFIENSKHIFFVLLLYFFSDMYQIIYTSHF